MEDIKLWELNGTQAEQLAPNQRLESEGLLEETLVNNPDMLIDGVRLVGRQTPTEGGPLDLLGIDPDGKLVVFELKRGTLSRDAVAQIIDYASDLDGMDLSDLADRISERSGAHGIDKIEDFQAWYTEEINEDLETLKPLRLVLVGLGTDARTERMVRYLAQNSGLDISMLTFHAFQHQDKTILAKQVEVEAAEETVRRSARRRRSPEELARQNEEKILRYGLRDVIRDIREMFISGWPTATQRADGHGLNFQLPPEYPTRRHARIDGLRDGTIRVVFFQPVILPNLDEFRDVLDRVPFRTYPKDRDPLDLQPQTEIHFRFHSQEWPSHKDTLTGLVSTISAAWQTQNSASEDGPPS